jgi:hypothetical protein
MHIKGAVSPVHPPPPPPGGVAVVAERPPAYPKSSQLGVRVVEVVVGAAVWVVKAVEVVEVRWSELPRPRLVFLALGLEGALGEGGSQDRRFYLPSRQSARGRERRLS